MIPRGGNYTSGKSGYRAFLPPSNASRSGTSPVNGLTLMFPVNKAEGNSGIERRDNRWLYFNAGQTEASSNTFICQNSESCRQCHINRVFDIHCKSSGRQRRGYPPAMAPMMKYGSLPDATAAGSGASGDS